jgi:phage I-like protein
MLIARHHVLLPEGVPEWVHLVPAGTFKGVDGRGPYKLTDAQAVIAASMANGEKPAIDENHSIDLAGASGQPSPARGWIVAMEARADGIWGKVDWTPPGVQLMTERAYRGISPVFEATKDGAVLRILRAALTNAPNLADLHKLHHRETGMDLVKLRAALGLPETADEAAILAAVTANHQAITAHAQQIGTIATAVGLAPTAPVTDVVTALQTQRANATSVERMAATITSLETQVATMRNDTARHAAETFVDASIKAGKPIVALRDHYIARHIADPKPVETEIAAMVSINTAGNAVVLNAQNPDGGGDGLTPTDKAVATKMGLDPKKFAEFKKTHSTTTDGRAA